MLQKGSGKTLKNSNFVCVTCGTGKDTGKVILLVNICRYEYF